jgi:regulatory protein
MLGFRAVDGDTRDRASGDAARDAAAHEAALRLLGPRALSESELRAKLAARGHGAAAIERVLGALRRVGLVDDLALARAVLRHRSVSPGLGRERLVAELERRGVAAAVAVTAWDELAAAAELDDATTLSRRAAALVASAGAAPDRRARARMYTALRRAGFDDDAVRAELARRGIETEPGTAMDES